MQVRRGLTIKANNKIDFKKMVLIDYEKIEIKIDGRTNNEAGKREFKNGLKHFFTREIE